MRNIKLKLFSVLLLAFTLILNISCANLLDTEEADTYITISMDESSRMIMPSVTNDSLTNISLYKNSADAANKLASWAAFDDMKGVQIPMEEGECTLILKATLGNTELQDSKTVTITEGANSVSFSFTVTNAVVSQTTEGKGSVKITLSYNGSGSVSGGVLRLTNASTSDVLWGTMDSSSGNGKLIFTKDNVPSGTYEYVVQASVGDKIATSMGYVLVADNLTSIGELSCKLTTTGLIRTINVTVKDTYNNTSVTKTLCAGVSFLGYTSELFGYNKDKGSVNYPVRDGYLFDGFLDENNNYVDKVPAKDCTVTVKWAEAKNLYFNTNEGSLINSQKIPLGDYLYLLDFETYTGLQINCIYSYFEVPVKNGYVFDGWYFDKDCTEQASSSDWNISKKIEGDITVYAKWAEGNAINFNTNGGSAVDSIFVKKSLDNFYIQSNYKYNYVYSTLTNHYSFANIPTPTKEGFVFAGWYTDAACENASSSSNPVAMKDGSVTFYAKWTEGKTITFNTNGASSATPDSIFLETGTKICTGNSTSNGEKICYISKYNQGYIKTFPVPTKEGCVFAGWYKDEALTQSASDWFTLDSNTTLYAKWGTACTLSFVTNTTGSMDSVNLASGNTYQITLRTNSSNQQYVYIYSSGGFSTSINIPENGTKIVEGLYTDSACETKLSRGSITVTENLTVYLKWADSYEMKFLDSSNNQLASMKFPAGKEYFLGSRFPFINGNYAKQELWGRPTGDSGYWSYSNVSLPEGKIVTGIYSDAALTTSANTVTLNSDKTFYLKLEDYAVVSLELNGGTNANNTEWLVPKGSYKYNVSTSNGQNWYNLLRTTDNFSCYGLRTPTKSGATFAGLYTDSGCTQSATEEFTVSGDMTIYVKWE